MDGTAGAPESRTLSFKSVVMVCSVMGAAAWAPVARQLKVKDATASVLKIFIDLNFERARMPFDLESIVSSYLSRSIGVRLYYFLDSTIF